MFVYDGVIYKIIKDDGSEMIVAEEVKSEYEIISRNSGEIVGVQEVQGTKNTLTFTGKTRRFALSALKAKISNKNAYDTYWISTQ